MYFEFVRGSEYKVKMENKPTVTSIDRCNSYIIIVDRVCRYIWLFLTSSKSPPITIAQKFLQQFKCSNSHRTVWIDQGGELEKASDFQKMVTKEKFILELAEVDTSA